MESLALEVEDLVMHFGPVRAVDGVTLRIKQGWNRRPARSDWPART